jgi:hypothetical protein
MRTGRPAELVVGSAQLGLVYGAANRTGKPTRDAAVKLVRRAAARVSLPSIQPAPMAMRKSALVRL